MPEITVARPLTLESKHQLSDIAHMSVEFSFHRLDVTPLGELAVTIVETGELHAAMKRSQTWAGIAVAVLKDRLAAKLPPTSQELVRLPVIGVDYFATIGYTRQLALVLDDPEGILHKERAAVAQTLPNRYWEAYSPYVPVAKLDGHYATSDVADWLNRHAPDSIELASINLPPRPVNTVSTAIRRHGFDEYDV
jgi:hypothetical protein